MTTFFKIAGTEYDRRRKVSDEEKETIRAEYRAGARMNDITKRYGISSRMVFYILRPDTIKKPPKKKMTEAELEDARKRNKNARAWRREVLKKQKKDV